ncbi:hypothetical protein BDZ90DRAFT_170559 [Jaminaea rosea]|uniref:Uncharacterized protein n=1 Tax=Jaminaea rosea TaxID=1569628 RepID=A0A316UR11_9BASI|nr:hypothetical protein BDZ90DRAFT_170559 [Jaminaea rosea]PWN27732.1 hypothetical protein BDZ90DRAFT_170559 [Jaminaea rosea]
MSNAGGGSFFFVRSTDKSAPSSSIASSSSAASSSSSSSAGSSRRPSRRRRSKASPPTAASLLPTIPDLRFEQSYLASVRGFIHELSPEQAEREKDEAVRRGMRRGEKEAHEGLDGLVVAGRVGDDDDDDDDEVDEKAGMGREARTQAVKKEEGHGEPELWIGRLRIDWLPLLHLTLRDQIFSPLVQGAIWAVVGTFLGQARSTVRSSVAAWMAARRRRTWADAGGATGLRGAGMRT